VYRVVHCLSTQHDQRLVALAVVICAIAALTSFKIYSHVLVSRGFQRLGLLLLTGVCSGAGVWATHFIAMLAYEPGVSTAYEPIATSASLFIAVAAATVGFAIASGSRGRWPGVSGAAFGGAVVGSGIALMHYTGMGALVVPGTLEWDSASVVASLAIGSLLAAAAMFAYHVWSARQRLWLAAGLLTLAICGLHFTAMGAVTIVPDPFVVVRSSQISDLVMAFAVTGATLVVMLSGITSIAFMESRTRRQREEELRVQNLRFETALRHMSQGLCMFDAEKRLAVCNDRYARLYRLPPDLLRVGTPHDVIIAHRVSNGVLKGESSAAAVAHKISALGRLPADASSVRVDELADGRQICITRQPMPGGGWVALHEDITDRRKSEEKILHMARHDALTDLPNRVLLRERLEQALASTRKGGRCLAVLLLDLDRFKEINDTLGHPVGDELLRTVAERLRSCVGETATIARLGGDEFAIVEDVTDPIAEATDLAQRIQETLSAPLDLGDHQVVVGSCIGIATAPLDGTDPDQLLKSADMALYCAKGNGRGTHCFFEPEMDRVMQARRDLERDLRNALVNGEFELHYQPVIDLQSGEISGCEALLRWHHPRRGLVLPTEFVSLAEETGLIVPIGEWVLRTACAEAATWPDRVKVAVNLSPAQFRSSRLLTAVVGALASSGVAAHRLELEITETALIRDSDTAFETLRKLHELGLRIALDDFGTGYSSLNFLRKFPFEKIKIDRSFVNELSHATEESCAIVRSVVGLATSLGKTTTAEGVETRELLDLVRAEGCTEAQGFYFSAPRPSSEMAALLRRPANRHGCAA
jgi:diguanylate cyclase (GGDEF)-like protein